jgi:hypothetical protein
VGQVFNTPHVVFQEGAVDSVIEGVGGIHGEGVYADRFETGG